MLGKGWEPAVKGIGRGVEGLDPSLPPLIFYVSENVFYQM